MSMRITVPIDPTSVGAVEMEYTDILTCFASDNDFIPVSCLRTGIKLKSTNGKQDFMYKVRLYHSRHVDRRYANFLMGMETAYIGQTHKMAATNGQYLSTNQMILFEDLEGNVVPLMAFCLKQKHLFNSEGDRLHPDRYSLIVDNSFINNDLHFKIYRNVKKYYIDKVSPDIDMVFTNSIKKACFNNEVKAPVFKKLTDKMKYSQVITQDVITELMEYT